MKSRCSLTLCFFLLLVLLFAGCYDEQETTAPALDVKLTDLGARHVPMGKPLSGVESRLGDVVDAWHDLGPMAALNKARGLSLPVENDRIRVVFVAQQGMASGVAAALEDKGAQVEKRFQNLVQALVRPEAIEPLSLELGVEWVRPPLVALPQVTSEGVAASGARTWQQSPGFADSGSEPVRVAVVDLGFDGYSQMLGTELPGSVDARSFRADNDLNADEPHGAGVAELVYDMAPDADLSLVNFSTEVELADAAQYVVNNGASIITHSVGWFNAGPGNGTGPISDIVRQVTATGVLWVNAAGNEAQTHWEGVFQSADGDGFHDFAPGDETNSFRALAGESIWILMNWNDWFASSNDYDLELFFDNGVDLELVASSTSVQNGSQEPVEAIYYDVPRTGRYHIALYKQPAARALLVEIFALASFPLEHAVSEGSLVIPADSADVIAVGAAHWSTRALEPFSSRGPTSDRRTKPDITAWDGVSTRTYGPQGFFGTSAATPHIAGALALMKSKVGAAYSNAELRDILYARADEAGQPGFDNAFGRGLLDMLP